MTERTPLRAELVAHAHGRTRLDVTQNQPARLAIFQPLREHLVALAEHSELLAGIEGQAFIDIDSLLRPVYGHAAPRGDLFQGVRQW